MKNLQDKKLQNLINYGDCFQLGDHILICGDSRDSKLLEKVIGKQKISLVITDPPYGVEYTENKAGFSKVKMDRQILNDDIVSELQYSKFTKDWIIPILPHLEKKNTFYIFNSDKMLFALRDGMIQSRIKYSQLLIWIKNHAVIDRKDYLPMHELIAVGWHGTHAFRKAKDKSIIFCPKPSKSSLHPTQKPISLLRRLILNSTLIGDFIYDCFGGSGSTMMACEQTKRKCIMIEFDPRYCQTIIDRCDKIFGIKAKRI
ncbi:MAG: site-specific DNA-methyltransferase [bacterium]